jgi:hypothetical protein
MFKHNYPNQQYFWCETGLHYEPLQNQSIGEEKAILAKTVEAFITTHSLNHIIGMAKLHGLRLQLATNDGEYFRHRLCNQLWRWAEEEMKEKRGADDINETRGQVFVYTNLAEDYDHVNMMRS